MMTKQRFLTELERELRTRYDWAKDAGRLRGAMNLARATLTTDSNLCTIDGAAWAAAWQAIGGKGKPTYKALRDMPSKTSAGPIARHVMMKTMMAGEDDAALLEAEGCIQATIAQKVGGNQLAVIRAAILDRTVKGRAAIQG